MSPRRDPVQRRENGDVDLHDVAEWEPKTVLDRLVWHLYTTVTAGARVLLVLFAVTVLLLEFVVRGGTLLLDPVVVGFVAASAVPALALAGYVWYADVTSPAPARLLVGTFLLGLVFVAVAGLLNTAGGFLLGELADRFDIPAAVVTTLLFVLVVGPVEESVKLFTVYLYAYQSHRFDAVIHGAVYGAAAGLGFATMENALYIVGDVAEAGTVSASATEGGVVTAVRALAGPGHVIYSAFAGYYLGLARFNRRYAGPVVLKGLLIATVLHATYNVLVSEDALFLPGYVAELVGVSEFAAVVSFVVAYVGILTVLLIYKLSQYRAVYQTVHDERTVETELTEFERDVE